jgi:hypothetical protein
MCRLHEAGYDGAVPPLGSLFDKLFEKLDELTSPENNAPDTILGEYRAVLERALQQPLPPELAAPPPRPDVWGTRGYLAQPRYEALYKPLLLHGQVTRGVVYRYEGSTDPDGRDVSFDYAWYVGPGRVRTVHVDESFDGYHAVFGAGQGNIVLDVDADLGLGKVLTLLHDGSRHVIYEALRTDPEQDPAVQQATREAEARARRLAGPRPLEDVNHLRGNLLLLWKREGEVPVLRLVKEASSEPVCLVRPDAAEPGAWRLYRLEPAGERPWMRILPATSAGASSTWRIVGEQGEELGLARTRGERLFVTHRGRPMMLSGDGKGGWTAEDERAEHQFSCEPAPSGEGLRLSSGGKESWAFQVLVEVLLLAVVAAGQPWSSSP